MTSTQSTSSPPAPSSGFRAVLAQRDFAFLWSGQSLSNIGNQMFPIALAVLVLERASVTSLGIVLAVHTAALGAGTLAAAAVGDRWRRTRMMAVADGLRIIAVAGLALTPTGFPFAGLVALTIVVGIGEGLFQPAFGAVMPKVVPSRLLQAANGLNSFSLHLSTVAGPALAGVFTALWGPKTTLWIDTGTFALSLATLVVIREAAAPDRPSRAPGLRAAVNEVVADLREGIQAVLVRRWLAASLVTTTVVLMFSAAPALLLLPAEARARLGGDEAYGAVLAAAGVGSVLGALLAARIRPRRPGLVAIGFGLLNATSMAGLALLPLPGVLLTWALAGMGVTVFNVVWITAIQRDVPERLLGRVMALDWLASTGLMPLGYLLAGPLASHFGAYPLLIFGSVFALIMIPLPLLAPGGTVFRSDQPGSARETAAPQRSSPSGA